MTDVQKQDPSPPNTSPNVAQLHPLAQWMDVTLSHMAALGGRMADMTGAVVSNRLAQVAAAAVFSVNSIFIPMLTQGHEERLATIRTLGQMPELCHDLKIDGGLNIFAHQTVNCNPKPARFYPIFYNPDTSLGGGGFLPPPILPNEGQDRPLERKPML